MKRLNVKHRVVIGLIGLLLAAQPNDRKSESA